MTDDRPSFEGHSPLKVPPPKDDIRLELYIATLVTVMFYMAL